MPTVPPLSNNSLPSPAPSSSAITTMASDLAANNTTHILQEDEAGALTLPSPPTSPLQNTNKYICLFHLLDCHSTFASAGQWKTHVLSHFRTHPPPNTARCPLCPDEKFTDSPDSRAWDAMLDHVDTEHYSRGQTLAGSRPDFELMRYLFRLRIISVDQFKVLQLSPAPSNPAYHASQDAVRASIGSSDEPFCTPYSRRREQRLRGVRGGIGVV
ncbi:hypothetical protein PHISCL_10074 [Aspergillus sclerotialis]|uniref:Uncharacterized protein n=1 Tax=Aspergillus sclerotialis TaxID=2070753 RepID=A0A3A2Z3E2_9EURO|nr:hypothetical protein PHISCL_10074 [Aspergillus sclerotialis]